MAFSPDGRFLVLAGGVTTSFGSRGYLIVRDLREGKILRRKDGRDAYMHVSFTSDNKRIVAASHFEVHVYDVQDWKQTVLGDNWYYIKGIALSQDGKMVAAAGVKMVRRAGWLRIFAERPRIIVYDLLSGKSLRTLRGESADSVTVTFSPDSGILAAASETNITLWNTKTWNIEGSLSLPVPAPKARCRVIIDQLSFMGNDGLIVVDWPSSGVRLWDRRQGKWLWWSVGHSNARVSGNGNRLAMVNWNQKTTSRILVLRDLPAEATVATLDLGDRDPDDLTLSPDGTRVAWVEWAEGLFRRRGKVFLYSTKD